MLASQFLVLWTVLASEYESELQTVQGHLSSVRFHCLVSTNTFLFKGGMWVCKI